MNRLRITLLFIVLICTFVLVKAQVPFYGEYRSPSRNVVLKVLQEEGRSFFTVYFNGKLVVDQSLVGVETSYGSFYSDLTLRSRVGNKVSTDNYNLVVGKKSNIKTKYREVIYPLVNLQGKELDLIFRVSDDGVAYRYGLVGRGECTLFKEYGNFVFPSDTKGYMTPLSSPRSGWSKTNPSYEEHYVYNVPVGTPSSIGSGWTYPALFNVPGSGWVMLSETGTDAGYCGTHLSDNSDGGVYKIEFPSIEEGLYSQGVYPKMILPYKTPWRMMIVGSEPCRIAESTMATDLVEPLYKAKYEYKPGKASWSWLVLKDDSITYDITRRFIDMASYLDFEYCLVDAPWDKQIGREKIAELSQYAQSRNVGLLLWYNSNGQWNDAPQTPKDCMFVPEIRRKEMKWMQSIGIKGIKVDFFGGDKQFYMQYYKDILVDANEYGLTVNFHGTTLPRGWEKMYPNFVTDESVKGMEFVTFEQENANLQPRHCATLPFIRNVVGPMDFTPLILNERLGPNRRNGPMRKTTAAFELALPVVFFSGVQHFGLIPENIGQYEFFVTDYLRAVPTVWDETRFLSGMPGADCVVARRSDNVWFVAGINGEDKEKEFKLNFSGFLKAGVPGSAIVDRVGSRNMVDRLDVITPNKKSTLDMKVPAYGGFVIMFTLAKK